MFTKLAVNLSDDPRIAVDLDAVVHSAVKEATLLFPWSLPAGARPIRIFYRRTGPVVRAMRDPNAYEIGLSVKDRHYSQLVFQLGHELCHIAVDPRRSNWFIESCCEMASLALLHRMSNVWTSTPPYPNWASYAPSFKKYAEERVRDAAVAVFRRACMPDEPQLRQWLITAGGSFSKKPLDRRKNIIIAEMLRPFFQEAGDNWEALRFLGRAGNRPPDSWTDLDLNSTFRFDKWLEAVPEHLKDLVQKISTLFDTSARGTTI